MLGINLETSPRAPWWPEGARFAADFVGNRYMRDGISVTKANAIGFTRASPKLAQDSAGIWHSFDRDVPARTDRGLLLEPAATNMVPNSAMLGAAPGLVGAGGALPTGWAASAFDAITVHATGTETGLPFIELRAQASNSTGSTRYALIHLTQPTPASAGQQWTASAFYKHIAGAWQASDNSFLNVEEKGDTTSYRYTARTTNLTTRTRLSHSWTTDSLGAIQLTFRIMEFAMPPGTVIDVTARIYAPQLALEPAASSPIITTGTTAARAADTATLLLPPGSFTLTQTFDSGSPDVTAGVSGYYELPGTTSHCVRQAAAI